MDPLGGGAGRAGKLCTAPEQWGREQRGNTVAQQPIPILGVWLIKEAGTNGKLQVLVELPGEEGYREAIWDVADDGPISHYVHPSGIAQAKRIDITEKGRVEL